MPAHVTTDWFRRVPSAPTLSATPLTASTTPTQAAELATTIGTFEPSGRAVLVAAENTLGVPKTVSALAR